MTIHSESRSEIATSPHPKMTLQSQLSTLKIPTVSINRDQLMDDIHFTAQFGMGERWGE